jgi:DNA-binding MarR family transcriptional regulator
VKIEEEIKQEKFRSIYQKATVNLLYTANWLESQNKNFFKSYDITPHQFNILRILRGQFPNKISAAEIKTRMLDRNSDVSRLLDRMITKEFISKGQCENDKRATDIVITQKGLNLLEAIDGELDKIEKQTMNLTREEAAQLSNLLDKSRG